MGPRSAASTQLSLLDASPTSALKVAAPATRTGQLAGLLEHHARQVSHLADELTRSEAQWLAFMNATGAGSLPATLGMVERIERLRGTMIAELHRAAALTVELTVPPAGKLTMTVRDNASAAVLLAPRSRRAGETK